MRIIEFLIAAQGYQSTTLNLCVSRSLFHSSVKIKPEAPASSIEFIYSEEQFGIKLNYVHLNPVKAGVVRVASDYEFSSAKNWENGDTGGFISFKF